MEPISSPESLLASPDFKPSERRLLRMLVDWAQCICRSQDARSCRLLLEKCPTHRPTRRQWCHLSAVCIVCLDSRHQSQLFSMTFSYLNDFITKLSDRVLESVVRPQGLLRYLVWAVVTCANKTNEIKDRLGRCLIRLIFGLVEQNRLDVAIEALSGLRSTDGNHGNVFSPQRLVELSRKLIALAQNSSNELVVGECLEVVDWCGGHLSDSEVDEAILRGKFRGNANTQRLLLRAQLAVLPRNKMIEKSIVLLKECQIVNQVGLINQIFDSIKSIDKNTLLTRFLVEVLIGQPAPSFLSKLYEHSAKDFEEIREKMLEALTVDEQLIEQFPSKFNKCSDYTIDNAFCLLLSILESGKMAELAFSKLDELIEFAFDRQNDPLIKRIFSKLAQIATNPPTNKSDRLCRLITDSLTLSIHHQNNSHFPIILESIKSSAGHQPSKLFIGLLETFVISLPLVDQTQQLLFLAALESMIARIGSNLADDKSFNLFRNFWTYLALQHRIQGKIGEDREILAKLAQYSPVLVRSGEHLRSLEFNALVTSFSRNIDHYTLRTLLMQSVAESSAEAKNAIETMSWPKLLFLNAIHFIETLRIEGAEVSRQNQAASDDDAITDFISAPVCHCTIANIFKYLDEPYVQTDKTNIFVCVECVAWNCFRLLLTSIKQSTSQNDNNRPLGLTVQFLLQKSCVQCSQVARVSRQMLDNLLGHRDLLVRIWTYRFVSSWMNLIQTLTASLGTETGDSFAGVKMRKFLMAANKKTSIRIPAYEKYHDKRARLEFFIDLWTRILTKIALPALPLTTRSHIQHFVFATDIKLTTPTSANQRSLIGHDQAIALTIDLVTKFDRADAASKSVAATLLNPLSNSQFHSTLLSKSYCVGYIYGIRHISIKIVLSDLRLQIGKYIADSINEFDDPEVVVVDEDRSAPIPVDELLYKISALLVYHEKLDFVHQMSLLDMVAIVPAKILSPESIRSGIECWCWLLSARADLQFMLIDRILRAWHRTVIARAGLFATSETAIGLDKSTVFSDFDKPTFGENADSNDSSDDLDSLDGRLCDTSDLEPHRLWIEFLSEQLDLALATKSPVLCLFESFASISLPSCEESPRIAETALHARPYFQILLMAAKLAKNADPETADSLTERVLGNALRYFSTNPRSPTRSAGHLKRDISVMCSFFDRVLLWKELGCECNGDCENRPKPKSDWILIDRLRNGDEQTHGGGFSANSAHNHHRLIANRRNHFVRKSEYIIAQPPIRRKSTTLSASDFKFPVESEYDNLADFTRISRTSSASTTTCSFKRSQTWPFPYTRRDLLLALLALEIRRLSVHVNPLSPLSLTNAIYRWADFAGRPEISSSLLDIAWFICPKLAVWVYSRILGDSLRYRLRTIMWNDPQYTLLECPYAVRFIAEGLNDRQWTRRFYSLLTLWRSCNPIDALAYLFQAGGHRQFVPSDNIIAYGRSSSDHRRFFSRTSQSKQSQSGYAQLLLRVFPHQQQQPNHCNPALMQYACRSLSKCKPQTLFLYIPQIVQSIRFDSLGYAQLLVVSLSRRSNLLAHQFIWNMQTNCSFQTLDEETSDDLELKPKLEAIIQRIIGVFDGPSLLFYKRQFAFTNDLVGVSGKLRTYAKGIDRCRACNETIVEVKLPESGSCYLPCTPDSLVLGIKYESAKPMQSAMKAPYRCSFDVQQTSNYDDIEEISKNNEAYAHIVGQYGRQLHRQTLSDKSSPVLNSKRSGFRRRSIRLAADQNGECEMVLLVSTKSAIFKVGDDVRQDMLGIQLIRLFGSIFKNEGLELYLFPYNVLATSPGRGVIECVPDSKSRDEIGRLVDGNILHYFIKTFGPVSSDEFQRARQNFIRSMAPYSLVLFLLQVKDRHNGNIMINSSGHIIHIDFGFMFETSPGGNIGIEPDIKLTDEMIRLMGGRGDGGDDIESFDLYRQLCVRGFLALRPYRKQICDLVGMMLETKLPCFLGKTIELLNARFRPDLNDQQAAGFLLGVIYNCTRALRTHLYDVIQYYQNQIPY